MASSSSSQPPDAVSWSDLPGDVLGAVASLLPSLFDLLRFRSVCRSWRDAAATCAPPSLPHLMFSDEGGADDAVAHRCFYSLSDGRIHRVRLPEEARRWRCCGSSHGWLAMVGLDTVVRLLNPLSGAQLEFPPLTTLPEVLHVVTGPETDNYYDENGVFGRPTDPMYPWYIIDTHEGYAWARTAEELRDELVQKVVASPPPVTPSDLAGCTVMMLYDDFKVAYARPGDESWTSLWKLELSSPWYEDLVPYQDKFYLLTWAGAVREVDFAGAASGPPRIEKYSPEDESSLLDRGARQYLSVARPSGEFILVRRHLCQLSGCPMQTERFGVSRREEDGGGRRRWVAAESLGGGALFLGNDCSTWVSCAPTGSGGGCTGDCIYFIADNMEYRRHGDPDSEGVLEVGVYHMNEGDTERLLPHGCQEIAQNPIWISPSL